MDDLRHIWPEMHERHTREPLICALCGAVPATCVGSYSFNWERDAPSPACDDCCSHDQISGRCEPLSSDNDATGVKKG